MEPNSNQQVTPLVGLLRSIVMVVLALTGYVWVNASLSGSDERQILSIGLMLLGGLGILGVAISLLTLAVSQAAIGLQSLSTTALKILRFYAFQKGSAFLIAIVVFGIGVLLFVQMSSGLWMYAVLLFVCVTFATLPDTHAWLVESNWYYRIFRSGTNPDAEFAQSYHLRRVSKPFEETSRGDHGYCADALFVGTSTRESSIKPLDIWDDGCVSEIVFATTGAGKFVTDIAPRLVTYMGSAVYCSVKPELADFGLGRNVDLSHEFAAELRAAGKDPGVDPREITSVKSGKPRFRSMLVDPYRQSVYGERGLDCSYTFFEDIPESNPDVAIPRAQALAWSLIEEKVDSNADPFFEEAPRSVVFSAIGHVKTRFPVELQNLPTMADFLMGKDPRSGGASEEQFRKNLLAMASNPSWGGTIASGAARMLQAGSKSFGSINFEIGNKLSWCQEPSMRRHLSGANRFSYEEVGNEQFPLSVFIIPGRVAPKASAGFMKCHAAMSLAVFKTRLQRPRIPVLWLGDEFRQYGGGIGLAENALVLRDNRIRLVPYLQDVASAKKALGEHEFEELMSASSIRFYGVGTYTTAELVSQMLGNRWLDGREIPLADPQTIMRELSVRSDLQYVVPYSGPPVLRLHRRGFKTIRTKEGTVYQGLPLQGYYDEHLSQFQN